MPNTKSAERRMRSSVRKHSRNHSTKASLKTLEKNYSLLVTAGKKAEAAGVLRTVSSAFDKAAKRGSIPKRTANRKKSRLAARLNRLK